MSVWAVSRPILGACRTSNGFRCGKKRTRFLGYALNSSSELEYHLIVARVTQVIPEGDFISMVDQTITVRKMLYGLLKRVSVSRSAMVGNAYRAEKGPQPSPPEPTAPGR